MDIQKGAAYANIGSFLVGCAALYIMWNPQAPQRGAVTQGWTVPPLMWVFLAGLVASGALHAYAASVQGRSKIATSAVTTAPTVTPPMTPPGASPAVSFGTETVLPDGRAIISCTQDDIALAYKNHTIDQFNRTLGGKWVKMWGEIAENHGEGLVFLKGSPVRVLRFAEGWEEPLSELPRGAVVTFRGQIGKADSGGYVRIKSCELL